MIIQQIVNTICFCDKCGAGMVQSLLDKTLLAKAPISALAGQKVACIKCGHENDVEKVFICIPETSFWVDTDDLSRLKKDTAIKDFLENEETDQP